MGSTRGRHSQGEDHSGYSTVCLGMMCPTNHRAPCCPGSRLDGGTVGGCCCSLLLSALIRVPARRASPRFVAVASAVMLVSIVAGISLSLLRRIEGRGRLRSCLLISFWFPRRTRPSQSALRCSCEGTLLRCSWSSGSGLGCTIFRDLHGGGTKERLALFSGVAAAARVLNFKTSVASASA